MANAWRRWRGIDTFQKVVFLVLFFLAVFMSLPIVYMINHAFKPINELFLYPPRIFVQHPTVENFYSLLLKTQSMIIPFTRYLFNSVLTTGVTVVAVIVISAMAAYAFSKHPFPGNKPLFALTILALMFTPEVAVIPRYLVIANIGIMNTYMAHIIPLLAAPVCVFLMKGFIDQIPNELMEAAKIDGAHEVTIFSRIVMPVCMPAIATVAILTFQSSWNQVETSSLFTQSEELKTLPYYVLTLTNGVANNLVGQGIAAAAALIVFLPSIFIFLIFQRRVMATMAHSGIK